VSLIPEGHSDRLNVTTANRLERQLVTTGWSRQGASPGLYTRWVKRDRIEVGTLLVPQDPERADFQELLLEAVSTYGAIESGPQASEEDWITRLSEPATDELLFRKETPRRSQRISWPDGMELHTAAEATLVSAAKATLRRQRYFGRQGAPFAGRFVKACFMGQTQVGSYVVTAQAPVTELFYERINVRPGASQNPGYSGRSITEVLVNAVVSLQNAADHYQRDKSVSGFEAAVRTGASSDMAKAVRGLVSGNTEAEVTVDWSGEAEPHVTAPVDQAGVTTLSVDPQLVPALDAAVQQLSMTPVPQSVIVRGWITVISRPRPGEPGRVRMRVLVGSEAETVRIALSQSQFEIAADAIANNREVQVTGVQSRERSSYWVRQVASVEQVTS
jgi:hypothetical protein